MTATATPPTLSAPFSAEQTKSLVDQYNREGLAHLGHLLTPDEVSALRQRVDEAFDNPRNKETHNWYGDISITRLFELDPVFVRMLTREPVISLMEAILGSDCHIIANNVVRNPPGKAIDAFHVDDLVWNPLPPEIPRHDARITLPNYLVNVQFALTDIPSDEYGPTQIVPGSHYSGRNPPDPKNPSFEGRGPVSMLARAGDVYLQHPQTWHRGAPNTSNRTRYVYQQAWGMRFVAQRFYPFMNYRLPEHVLEGADERLLRVLGKHPKGAYG
jgi:ectoine hydroxylase-related dioxygenase (phytanoyl-CoA dioxygenase family)